MARSEEPAPNAYQRWVADHAPVLYVVGAVLTAYCVWRLVGALMSPATRDVVAAALNTLTWVLLTVQVRVAARYVARYDRRTSASRMGPSAEHGRS